MLLLLTDLDLELRYNLDNRVTLPTLKHKSDELLNPSNNIKDLVLDESVLTKTKDSRVSRESEERFNQNKSFIERLLDWVGEKTRTFFNQTERKRTGTGKEPWNQEEPLTFWRRPWKEVYPRLKGRRF